MLSFIYDNLPVLFAVAIAITWTGQGMAGFSALIAFFIMHNVIGALIDITGVRRNERMLGTELGIKTMQTGVFGGILVGFLTTHLYRSALRKRLLPWKNPLKRIAITLTTGVFP